MTAGSTFVMSTWPHRRGAVIKARTKRSINDQRPDFQRRRRENTHHAMTSVIAANNPTPNSAHRRPGVGCAVRPNPSTPPVAVGTWPAITVTRSITSWTTISPRPQLATRSTAVTS